jgi:hypothetical protein
MFIAMNRFKVLPGAQAEFEQVWTSRDTRLRDAPGFLVFHLLRGPDRDDHTLYSSHSDVAEPRRVRGVDPVGGISARAPRHRRQSAALPWTSRIRGV